MKKGPAKVLIVGIMVMGLIPALAQGVLPREDVIWARRALAPITLDGVLNEAAWAQAESTIVQYAQDAGIPGSGWKVESGGFTPIDPTYATLKFLIYENQLYLGARVQDAYVGGSEEFNRFDGFLMAIKDHLDTYAPKPPAEYLYSWWYRDDPDPQPPGQLPSFKGRWAEEPIGSPRTPEQVEAWDAVTVVHGLSNDDSVLDEGYTVEMRFNLTPMGYDVTQPEGDVVEWNISIYDCDGFWPFNAPIFTTNRVWWQSPWGNQAWYNEVRVFGRPDVTVASGPVPAIGPEFEIPRLITAVTVDGALSEMAWDDRYASSFDIRYGDDALRQTYSAVGPYRAGQYQPSVNGGLAFVADPGDATVEMFVAGETLYLGFDVRDMFVQYHPDFNRWDGFLVTINERVEVGPDHQLLGRRLSFQVAANGTATPQDYLATLVSQGKAQVAIQLKAGTAVDTLGVPDTGYTAELAVDLTGLGYTPGMVEGPVFLGITLLDGDSFSDPIEDSYGTRTWWYREYEGECCSVWAELSSTLVGVGQDPEEPFYQTYGQSHSYPNPSLQPRISYWLPEANRVTLEVYDLRGQLVERRVLGDSGNGFHDIPVFSQKKMGSGVYVYRLKLQDPATGVLRSTLTGKTLILK
jgi:hypothetical protein